MEKKSKQARKQRLFRYKAPLHLRHRLLSTSLSKELRKKYQRRAFPLRKGDLVKIRVGKFKGKSGKISAIDLYKLKVYIEGIQVAKKDGTKVNVPIDPSNLQILELNLEDKERKKALERKIKESKEGGSKNE